MVELTPRQEAKIITFANKAFSKISEIADQARAEKSAKKRRAIVRSGNKLAKYLIAIDDSRNQWDVNTLLGIIDRLINEYDLFEVPFNPTQLNINDLTTRIIGSDGGDDSGNVTTSELNAEATARINADTSLQNNIDTTNQRITDLDFTGLVPNTAVFSEATPGFKDFPTELGLSLPNKSVLDAVTNQDLLDIDSANAHRANNDIHVTLSQKNDWDTRVTQSELSSGLSTKANINHTHPIGQIQNLQAELDALAQSILDNAAEDGVTPSISIGSVTSGQAPSVSLGSGSTTANPILDFVLVTGDKGDKGDPFTFDAIDFLANRSNYINEPFGFSFVDVQTGLVYYKQAGSGVDEWSGGIRTIGDRGWTPVHALEPKDGGVYLKLVDYINGQGTKPTENIGAYVSPTGYVTSTLAATNLKGNKGDSPVAGIDYELPRFKIDVTLSYANYLSQQSSLLNNQPVGYTVYFSGSVSPNENKNGLIAIIGRNANTGAKEWKEYEFKGDQGPAGVPGPKGDPGEVPEAPIDGLTYARKDGTWVENVGGVAPEDIINDFSVDPDDSTKVAGANAVFTLFPKVDANYTNLGATPSFDLNTADIFKRTANVDVTNLTITGGVEGKVYKLYIKIDATGGYSFTYDDTIIQTQDGIELILPNTALSKHLFQVELMDNGKYFVQPIYDIEDGTIV